MNFSAEEVHGVIKHTIDGVPEDRILRKLSKDVFFEILKKSEIDLEKLVQKRKKNDYLPFHKFNFILKELHNSEKIGIADSAIYLEMDMFSAKEIFACLNEENMYELRKTMAERHNIPLMRTKTDMFLYKGKKKNG